MSTLTPMERTETGWRCPRCGSTQEDTILPVRQVECNCAGLGVHVLPVDKILGMLSAVPAWEDGPVHAEPISFETLNAKGRRRARRRHIPNTQRMAALAEDRAGFQQWHAEVYGTNEQDAFHEHLKTSGTNPGGPGLKGLTLLGPDGEEME